MVAADARTAITFSLSPGQARDAPAGRELLFQMVLPHRQLSLWIARTKGMKRGSLPLIWVICPLCRQKRTASTLGNMIARSVSVAMKCIRTL